MRLDQLEEHVDHFRTRVLQDAMTDATADYWRRRARSFEAALPRPGDFTGGAPAAIASTYWPTDGTAGTYWFPGGRPLPADRVPRRVPVPGATPEQIEAQRMRVASTILACAQRAELMIGGRIE